jgi:hypothetical protein
VPGKQTHANAFTHRHMRMQSPKNTGDCNSPDDTWDCNLIKTLEPLCQVRSKHIMHMDFSVSPV